MSISIRKEQRQPPYNSLGYTMEQIDIKKENAFRDAFRQKLIDVCSDALVYPSLALRKILSIPMINDLTVGMLAGNALTDLSLPDTKGYLAVSLLPDEPGEPFLNIQILSDMDTRGVNIIANRSSLEIYQWTHVSNYPTEIAIGNALIALASAQRTIMEERVSHPQLLMTRAEIDKIS